MPTGFLTWIKDGQAYMINHARMRVIGSNSNTEIFKINLYDYIVVIQFYLSQSGEIK